MKFLRLVIPLIALMLLPVLGGVSFAAGGGPGDAIYADGSAQTVAPHSELWFRFEYGGENQIDVTLDANDAAALRFNVYTPQAVADWQNGETLKKIGEGSNVQNHDLGWSGRFNFPGTFFVVAYNDGDAPATVNVKAVGEHVRTSAALPPPPKPTALPNPFQEKTPVGKGIAGKLAFLDAQGGNLYTVNGDGTNLQRVSFGMDPQWNHAGNQIALARQGPTAGIFTINADGSNEKLLYATQEPRAPDWKPDDAQLVFSRQTAAKGGGEFCFRGRCFTLPATSEWKLGLVKTADGEYGDVPTTNHAFTPTWNPIDATKIAFNDKAIGIVVTKTEAKADDMPTFEPIIGDLRPGVGTYDPLQILSPQYSPDGKYIVMMVGQPPTWQIAIANADGSNRHLLTRMNPLDFTHANNVAPVWSPDGKQILFLSDRNQTGDGSSKWEFFVMNADGSNVQQVLKDVTDQLPLSYSYQGERMASWAK